METTNSKLNFTDYYKNLPEIQSELKKRIIDRLGISDKTFYNKINSDSWNAIEREAIENIVESYRAEIANLI